MEEDAILGGLQTGAFDLSSWENLQCDKEVWQLGEIRECQTIVAHTHTRRRNEDNQDWMPHLSTDATGEPTRFRWIEEKGGRCSNRIAATVQADSKFQLAGVPPGAATVHHDEHVPFSTGFLCLTKETNNNWRASRHVHQPTRFTFFLKENSTWLGPHQEL